MKTNDNTEMKKVNYINSYHSCQIIIGLVLRNLIRFINKTSPMLLIYLLTGQLLLLSNKVRSQALKKEKKISHTEFNGIVEAILFKPTIKYSRYEPCFYGDNPNWYGGATKDLGYSTFEHNGVTYNTFLGGLNSFELLRTHLYSCEALTNYINEPIDVPNSVDYIKKISGLDFYTKQGKTRNEFNFINPELIKWIKKNCIPVSNDVVSGVAYQKIYDVIFRPFVRELVNSYLYIINQGDFRNKCEEYKNAATVSGFSGLLYTGLYEKSDDEFKHNPKNKIFIRNNTHLDINTLCKFWIRRGIDNTHHLIWDILKEIMNLYDRMYFQTNYNGLNSTGHSLVMSDTTSMGDCISGNCQNGKGTMIYPDGGKYVGEFKDGKCNGQGTCTYSNGNKYVGEVKDNRLYGQGTYIGANGDKYVGEFKDDKCTGQGTCTYSNGTKYVGEFKDGKCNGQGTCTYSDGTKYVGEFKDGKCNGQGTYIRANGDKYVGEFKNDKFNGQGTYNGTDGEKYVGQFKDSQRNGQGTLTHPNGKMYLVEYKNGKQIGKGKFIRKPKIPKPTAPANLVITDITFNDSKGNSNNILDADESAEIKFALSNKGKGDAYALVMEIQELNAIAGVQFQKTQNCDNLPAGKTKTISIPLTASMKLETGKTNFKMYIKEGNDFNTDLFQISFNTQKFKNPIITLADHRFTTSEEGKIKLGVTVSLNIVVQNQGQGDATDIYIVFTNPTNVFPANETNFNINKLKPNESKNINYEFFANKKYSGTEIPINVVISESYKKYGESKTLTVSLEQNLSKTQYIDVNTLYEKPIQIDKISLTSDLDKNIPHNNIQNENISRGGGDPLKGLNISKAKDIVIGNYYALIIGIDNYKGSWTKLNNAVNDAKTLEALLKAEYKFNTIKTLYNEAATRKNIIAEIEWLAKNIKEKDNVLIYYSGHGDFKKEYDKGYWVPIDATSNAVSDYISNNDLQSFLVGIKSKHTLLISDACFSGDVMRGNTITVPFEDNEKYYYTVHDLNSRRALTSGNVEPVMDGGKDGHSVFTYYLLKALIKNQSKYFDASQLFEQIKVPVINNSDQKPQFSAIKNTGDEGGQFIFIKK